MTAEKVATVETVSAEDLLRADMYDFLSAFLARPPSGILLTQASKLEGDESDIGAGISALARLADAVDPRDAHREFNALFIGLGRGELLPHGSYYLTGFLNEKPLARLRSDMARLGIEREENIYEPEDNIASVCEMMSGLIRGRFGEPASISEQKEFFEAHLSPWAELFFKDLEAAESSVLFAPIGTIGRAFIAVEQDAFRMEG
ncbi:MAG: molecular chaperone TorD family protein [Hyphomicrobiales bacterium]